MNYYISDFYLYSEHENIIAPANHPYKNAIEITKDFLAFWMA